MQRFEPAVTRSVRAPVRFCCVRDITEFTHFALEPTRQGV